MASATIRAKWKYAAAKSYVVVAAEKAKAKVISGYWNASDLFINGPSPAITNGLSAKDLPVNLGQRFVKEGLDYDRHSAIVENRAKAATGFPAKGSVIDPNFAPNYVQPKIETRGHIDSITNSVSDLSSRVTRPPSIVTQLVSDFVNSGAADLVSSPINPFSS